MVMLLSIFGTNAETVRIFIWDCSTHLSRVVMCGAGGGHRLSMLHCRSDMQLAAKQTLWQFIFVTSLC